MIMTTLEIEGRITRTYDKQQQAENPKSQRSVVYWYRQTYRHVGVQNIAGRFPSETG